MKRIALCLDGTWNNTSRARVTENSMVYRPTNVLKVARAIRSRDENGIAQITYYDSGVGATSRAPTLRDQVLRKVDRVLGGGWGSGFEQNVEEAYNFLANNYDDGDEIYIFGFSRGAAQARSLVRFIEWAGGIPKKIDAYYVVELFDKFLTSRGAGSGQDALAAINNRRIQRQDPHRVQLTPAKIAYVGVWDTVLALGSRLLSIRHNATKKYRFHNSSTAPTTPLRIRHALAIDERRHDFRAEIWQNGNPADLQQRWYSGTHADVGGGLDDDRLANASLRWICDEAANLAFDQDFLKSYVPNALGKLCPPPMMYRVADTCRRFVRIYQGGREIGGLNASLDESVLTRLNNTDFERTGVKSPYRPENLLKFLAANPSYDSQITSEEFQKIVRSMRSV